MQLTTRIMVGILVAMLCAITQAAPNSKQRVATFAKLPDWSGVWERFRMGPAGIPTDPQQLKLFLAAMAARPPLNAAWNAKVDAAFKKQKQSNKTVYATCTPAGFPLAMMGGPELFQALITPEETTLIFYSGGVRHIDTDGRDHPPLEERWVTPMGDSVGRWEGDVLVVDTVANSAELGISDLFGSHDIVVVPLSEKVHTTERIRLLDPNTLENQMTIDDPLAFEHPWVLKITYHRAPGLRHTIPHDCTDDRNPVVDGQFTIAPPEAKK